MKIVLLNQYYAPDEAATAQMLADLGGALAALGHQVTAICCDRSYADPTRRYAGRERVDGVDVHRLPITAFGRSHAIGRSVDYLTFFFRAALRLVRVERPDVVISLTTPPMIALLGAAIARLHGAHSIMWCMDVYPEIVYEIGGVRAGSIAGRILRTFSSLTLRAQDLVIALGECMARRLERAGARRVEVVHNWSDEDAVTPADTRQSPMRREWGWGDRFVVLYSGNLGLAHEFDTVIAAAERFQDDDSTLFAFIGAGPQLAYVQRRRDELQLRNIDIRKPVPRNLLQQSLSAGDVHLITLRPRMPGLLVPSKLYGILAAGRPTLYVGPSEGEVFDIIRAESCGTCVVNGDVEGLVAAIARYRDHPTAVEADGTRARRAFERRFTKRRAMEQFVGLLDSLTTATTASVRRGTSG